MQDVTDGSSTNSGSVGAAPETELGEAPEVDWPAARKAYEETSEPVAAILERFGIRRWQFRVEQRRGGWRIRKAGRVDGTTDRSAMVRELDRKLLSLTTGLAEKLGDRVEAEGATDAAMRGLTGLLHAREAMMNNGRTNKGEAARGKKTKNNDGPAGRDGKGGPDQAAGADRAPELRAKIAERLDRLRGG